MIRFRYWTNAPFVAACMAYALNRWLLKPRLALPFLHNHFDDLVLIPCALPPLLWLHRKLGMRAHDDQPTLAEITGHLVFWSFFMEILGPHLVKRAVGDPLDMLAYAVGAMMAGLWWHRHRLAPLAVS